MYYEYTYIYIYTYMLWLWLLLVYCCYLLFAHGLEEALLRAPEELPEALVVLFLALDVALVWPEVLLLVGRGELLVFVC